MPDMQVDTSSYPKPVAGQNFLDTANKFQQLESNKLTIGRQKLDLINQQFQNVSKGLAGLANKPDLNEQDVTGFLQNGVKEGWLPADMAGTEISQIPSTQGMPPAKATATLKDWANQKLSMGQNVNDAINFHYGTPGSVSTGNQIVPTVSSPKFGTQQTQPGIPTQPPPTTPTVAAPNSGLPAGTPTLLGPSAPSQVLPPAPQASTNALPVGPRQVSGPIQGVGNVTGAEVGPDQPNMGLPAGAGLPTRAPVQTQSFNKPIQTGVSPMFDAGKTQFANDQQIASQKSQAMIPLIQAIPLLDGLTTGPGTETFNHYVALLKNAGFLDKATPNDKTVIYQEIKKKINQYVQGNPIAQRSDAAQALGQDSSPSLGSQLNPALVKLAKDAVAQDRITQSMPGAFEKTVSKDQNGFDVKSPEDDYSKYGQFKSTYPSQVDPDVFQLDFMPSDQRDALIANMQKKAKSNKASDRFQANKFFKTLDIVSRQGLINTEGQ